MFPFSIFFIKNTRHDDDKGYSNKREQSMPPKAAW